MRFHLPLPAASAGTGRFWRGKGREYVSSGSVIHTVARDVEKTSTSGASVWDGRCGAY